MHFKQGGGYKESGNTAEEFLGGESVRPKRALGRLEELINKNLLVGKRFTEDNRYKEQIKRLPALIAELIYLSEMHQNITSGKEKDYVRKKMFDLKKTVNHKLLEEALTRYIIQAHPDEYMPWAPVPLTKEYLKRNEWIADLHETICEKLNVENYDLVRFYNATQSPLDLLYSTDGFFVIDGKVIPDGKRRLIPLDITINKFKKELEANPSGSLVLFMDAEKLDEDLLDKYREEFANRILSSLKNTPPDKILDGFKSKFDT